MNWFKYQIGKINRKVSVVIFKYFAENSYKDLNHLLSNLSFANISLEELNKSQ